MGGHPVTFSRPELLAVAPLVVFAFLLALLAQRHRRRRLAEAFGGAAIERLLPVETRRFPTTRFACLAIAGLAICLAAAGLGGVTNRGPGAAVPLDIAIAVDLSLSMNASDIQPTRIQRARDVVIRLAKQLPKGRLSLIVFGDWPYTLVPPTEDPGVVAYFAESLTGRLVSNLASSIRTRSGDQGASLQAVLVQARAALDSRPTAGAKRVVLVVSDGAIPGGAEDAVTSAADGKGAVVWTAGIGTTRRAKLEVTRGNPVMAGFDEQLLRSVALAGGGVYEDVSDDRGLRALLSGLRQLSGVSDPGNVGPERATFWLSVLAIALLLWEGGLDAGKRLAFGPSKEGAG